MHSHPFDNTINMIISSKTVLIVEECNYNIYKYGTVRDHDISLHLIQTLLINACCIQ
jgi:hypothetical protein